MNFRHFFICWVLVLPMHHARVWGEAPRFAPLPFKVSEGFAVEQIYEVPDDQGSWVALAADDTGDLIASDQKGGLYRISELEASVPTVQPIDLPIGRAHGLLVAFDSLYAVVSEDVFEGPGLYRIRDLDNDDVFDDVSLLQRLDGTGEHGPHSVVLAPDGESLLVIAGNKTAVPEPALADSLVPVNWGEDDLLPRLWGPIGSEAGTPAPGGWVARVSPDGSSWQLLAIGLRNGFDLAHNRHGDWFTVDADAEFDLGTPWYQPTRVFHVVEGTDYGWRSGAGKLPHFYPDTLPPVVELGPGSPTGVVSGIGSSFPPPYQDALLVGDWSRGRLLAVTLTPDGSTYSGTPEEIVRGTPLPITDLVVHPPSGSIYFTLGGRGVSSGLYQLSWTGGGTEQDSDVNPSQEAAAQLRRDRKELSQLLVGSDAEAAITAAWPNLGHSDRIMRHTARLVLEQTPHHLWQDQALREPTARGRLTALLALPRSNDVSLLMPIIGSLTELSWQDLSEQERIDWLRIAELALLRLAGESPAEKVRNQLLDYMQPLFPQQDYRLDGLLCRLLVYLQSGKVPAVALDLVADSVTQQQRLLYAAPLRHQRAGWTPPLRERYFSLLADAANWHGGLSLSKYLERIGEDALQTLPASDRQRYAEVLRRTQTDDQTPTVQRPHVRDWTVDALLRQPARLGGGDLETGRRLYAELQCFHCHRFAGEGGGVGPDLTTVSSRLNTKDLLEAIVEPSKVISDQFAASTLLTADGRVLNGRVVNLVGDAVLVQTDMLRPSELERIKREDIESIRPSAVSMMPDGLLDTCTAEEIADLLAFLQNTPND